MNPALLPETESVGVEKTIIAAVNWISVESATLVVCKFLHHHLVLLDC